MKCAERAVTSLTVHVYVCKSVCDIYPSSLIVSLFASVHVNKFKPLHDVVIHDKLVSQYHVSTGI